jgi:hypothetical protein
VLSYKNGGLIASEICPENELPGKNSNVFIYDYPVGLMVSLNETTCSFTASKIDHFESKTTPPNSPYKAVIVSRKNKKPTPVKDSVILKDGRVKGSCGAPFFADKNKKVIAFHTTSADDLDVRYSVSSISSKSHSSVSIGRVLCRLPEFVKWYNVNLGKQLK